jgi:hypothetical protein
MRRLTTDTDNYRISTIDLLDADPVVGFLDTVLGATEGRYETMVFRLDAPGKVKSWSELECRRAGDEGQARKNHDELVSKWGAIPRSEGGE